MLLAASSEPTSNEVLISRINLSQLLLNQSDWAGKSKIQNPKSEFPPSPLSLPSSKWTLNFD
jgi:hypothetical protein